MFQSLDCSVLHKLFPNNNLTFYAKFSLKRLILNLEENIPDPDIKFIFWKFFICQVGLEELQLFNLPLSIRKSFYKYIFNCSKLENAVCMFAFTSRHSFFGFQHLTVLKMVAADISKEVLSLQISNPNITTLVFIDKGTQGEPAFRKVVQFFPNLKFLEYFSNHSKAGSFFKYLATNLLQLESLRTDLVESGDFSRQEFKKLKEVSFDGCIMDAEEWLFFVMDNPLIEKFSLNSFVLPAEAISSIVRNWSQLKTFELGFGLYTVDLMHEISDNCKSLMCLKMTNEMSSQFKATISKKAPGIRIFTNEENLGENQNFVMKYFLRSGSLAFQTMLNNFAMLSPIWFDDHMVKDEPDNRSNCNSNAALVDEGIKYLNEDELLFYNENLDVIKMEFEDVG